MNLLNTPLSKAESFSPDIILISCGYDLAYDDAEVGKLTPNGFYKIFSKISGLAKN